MSTTDPQSSTAKPERTIESSPATENAPEAASSSVSSPATDTRTRIAQILSATVSGCMSEMGFTPELREKLRELEAANTQLRADIERLCGLEAQLRAENTKLFADNRNLAQLIYHQNEIIAGNNHTQNIRVLQDQIRVFETERREMISKNQRAFQEIMFLRTEMDRLHGQMQAANMHPASNAMYVPQRSNLPLVGHHTLNQSSMHATRPGPPPPEASALRPPSVPRIMAPVTTSVRRPSSSGSRQTTPTTPHPLAQSSFLISHQPPVTPTQATAPRMDHPNGGGAAVAAMISTDIVPLAEYLKRQNLRDNTTPAPDAMVIDLTAEGESSEGEGPRKRRRLGAEAGQAGPITPTTAAPTQAQPEPAPTPAADHVDAAPVEPAPAAGPPTQGDAEPQPEDDTEYLQDCLEEAFDEVEDGDADAGLKLVCCMCRARFESGSTEQAPQPFVNASLQELSRHCEQDHPRGWEHLKNVVKQEHSQQ